MMQLYKILSLYMICRSPNQIIEKKQLPTVEHSIIELNFSQFQREYYQKYLRQNKKFINENQVLSLSNVKQKYLISKMIQNLLMMTVYCRRDNDIKQNKMEILQSSSKFKFLLHVIKNEKKSQKFLIYFQNIVFLQKFSLLLKFEKIKNHILITPNQALQFNHQFELYNVVLIFFYVAYKVRLRQNYISFIVDSTYNMKNMLDKHIILPRYTIKIYSICCLQTIDQFFLQININKTLKKQKDSQKNFEKLKEYLISPFKKEKKRFKLNEEKKKYIYNGCIYKIIEQNVQTNLIFPQHKNKMTENNQNQRQQRFVSKNNQFQQQIMCGSIVRKHQGYFRSSQLREPQTKKIIYGLTFKQRFIFLKFILTFGLDIQYSQFKKKLQMDKFNQQFKCLFKIPLQQYYNHFLSVFTHIKQISQNKEYKRTCSAFCGLKIQLIYRRILSLILIKQKIEYYKKNKYKFQINHKSKIPLLDYQTAKYFQIQINQRNKIWTNLDDFVILDSILKYGFGNMKSFLYQKQIITQLQSKLNHSDIKQIILIRKIQEQMNIKSYNLIKLLLEQFQSKYKS